MEAAWKGILTEAERLSDVHLKVKENISTGEMQQIKTWQKDNYHKVRQKQCKMSQKFTIFILNSFLFPSKKKHNRQ